MDAGMLRLQQPGYPVIHHRSFSQRPRTNSPLSKLIQVTNTAETQGSELSNYSVFLPAPEIKAKAISQAVDFRHSLRKSIQIGKFSDFKTNLPMNTGLLQALPPPPPPLEMNFNRPFKPPTRNRVKGIENTFLKKKNDIFSFKRRIVHPRPASHKIMQLFSPPVLTRKRQETTIMCSASKADSSSQKEKYVGVNPSYMLTFGGPEKPEIPSPAKSDDSPTRRTPRLFENPHSIPLHQKTCNFGGFEESVGSSQSTLAPLPSNKSFTSPDKQLPANLIVGDQSTEIGSSCGQEELKKRIPIVLPSSPLKIDSEFKEPPSSERRHSERKYRKPIISKKLSIFSPVATEYLSPFIKKSHQIASLPVTQVTSPTNTVMLKPFHQRMATLGVSLHNE